MKNVDCNLRDSATKKLSSLKRGKFKFLKMGTGEKFHFLSFFLVKFRVELIFSVFDVRSIWECVGMSKLIAQC